jgi:hypothetical protein
MLRMMIVDNNKWGGVALTSRCAAEEDRAVPGPIGHLPLAIPQTLTRPVRIKLYALLPVHDVPPFYVLGIHIESDETFCF